MIQQGSNKLWLFPRPFNTVTEKKENPFVVNIVWFNSITETVILSFHLARSSSGEEQTLLIFFHAEKLVGATCDKETTSGFLYKATKHDDGEKKCFWDTRRHFNSFITSEWSVNLTRGSTVIIIKLRSVQGKSFWKSFQSSKSFLGSRASWVVNTEKKKLLANHLQHFKQKTKMLQCWIGTRTRNSFLRKAPFGTFSLVISNPEHTMGGEVCKK